MTIYYSLPGLTIFIPIYNQELLKKDVCHFCIHEDCFIGKRQKATTRIVFTILLTVACTLEHYLEQGYFVSTPALNLHLYLFSIHFLVISFIFFSIHLIVAYGKFQYQHFSMCRLVVSMFDMKQ